MTAETYVENYAWSNLRGFRTIDYCDAVKRLRAWVTDPSASWNEDARRPVALELEARLATTRPRKRIAIDAREWMK